MESFLKDLRKDVQCSLCNDTLTEPKILPCFHTFCKLCITRNAELIDEVNIFKCPECKSLTSLPEECCFDSLKPNSFLSRILSVLDIVSKGKGCCISESHSPASFYCFECTRWMCHRCVKNHINVLDDHIFINLNELKLKDLELALKTEDFCTSHLGQRFKLFCQDCDVLVCMSCVKNEHSDHNLVSLDTMVSLKRDILSKHLETLERLSLNEQELEKQKQIAFMIKKNGEEAIGEVKNRTKQIIGILQENEKKLLKQINSKIDRATRNLNIIHHIRAVKAYINNVIEKGLASEVIHIQETQCSEDFIFIPIPEVSEIVFVPHEELMRQVVDSGLGEIQHKRKTDHVTSTVQLESEPEVLRQEKLVLMTKTSTGELNDDTGDVIDVRFLPEDNVEKIENHARTEGKIEIEFVAKAVGPLTAEVKVNGNHVCNSPLVMNVKPQQMRITRPFNMKGVISETHTSTGIAVSKDNSRVAVALESCSCVHIYNNDGDLLVKFGRKGKGERQLSRPEGLSFLNDTDLVIADNRNYRICIVNAATGELIKTFGKLGKRDGEFNDTYGVHVDDDGNIIACDYYNERVQVFTKDGDYRYNFGLTKQGSFHPVSTVTHRGRFFVSDCENNVIHVFENKDSVLTRTATIGESGSADGQLRQPWGLAIDSGHHLLVCDRGNNRVQKFTLNGQFVGKTCDKLKDPRYIVALNNDEILVSTFRSGLFIISKMFDVGNESTRLRSGRTRR